VKRFIPIVALVAIGLTACGGSDEIAATVNGVEIPASGVTALVGEDTASTPQQDAAALTTLIQWSVSEQAAEEEFGFAPTEDEIDAQVDVIVAQAGADSLDQIAEAQGVPVDILRDYIVQLMTRDAISAALAETVDDPTDDEVNTQLADFQPDWTTVCVSHLLVETTEEAEAAKARIEGGEDFATVASEVSTDTASAVDGGDLGCTTAGSYVDEFAAAAMDAPIDELTGPVETQFGFHLLVVTSREEATTDDVRASLKDQAVLDATDAWFLAAMEAADVQVTDGFGTWSLDPTPQVVAVELQP
jgi:foldase protein PrsA